MSGVSGTNYCIVESEIITNIIICDSDAAAKEFEAVPFYDGAKIGDCYAPPLPTPTPDEDRDALLVDLKCRTTLLELGVI